MLISHITNVNFLSIAVNVMRICHLSVCIMSTVYLQGEYITAKIQLCIKGNQYSV